MVEGGGDFGVDCYVSRSIQAVEGVSWDSFCMSPIAPDLEVVVDY
jgi:hypothetical protein